MSATLTVEYHDDTRTVVTYEGGQESGTRPYTAEENAAADLRNARIDNEAALTVDATAQIDVLLTSIASLQAIIDKTNAEIGAADTKDIARELKKVARQVVRLTRLDLDVTDSADTGTA